MNREVSPRCFPILFFNLPRLDFGIAVELVLASEQGHPFDLVSEADILRGMYQCCNPCVISSELKSMAP